VRDLDDRYLDKYAALDGMVAAANGWPGLSFDSMAWSGVCRWFKMRKLRKYEATGHTCCDPIERRDTQTDMRTNKMTR
jgi:hypothetical protein